MDRPIESPASFLAVPSIDGMTCFPCLLPLILSIIASLEGIRDDQNVYGGFTPSPSGVG